MVAAAIVAAIAKTGEEREPPVRGNVMFLPVIRSTERDPPSLDLVIFKRWKRMAKGWVSDFGRKHRTRIALPRIRNINERSATGSMLGGARGVAPHGEGGVGGAVKQRLGTSVLLGG